MIFHINKEMLRFFLDLTKCDESKFKLYKVAKYKRQKIALKFDVHFFKGRIKKKKNSLEKTSSLLDVLMLLIKGSNCFFICKLKKYEEDEM
jgi:hypothetical protein